LPQRCTLLIKVIQLNSQFKSYYFFEGVEKLSRRGGVGRDASPSHQVVGAKNNKHSSSGLRDLNKKSSSQSKREVMTMKRIEVKKRRNYFEEVNK
jgi:hypothetical protein